MKKKIVDNIGYIGVAVILLLFGATIGKTAVSELVGIAVAQSTIQWNSVSDAARGDALTNGIMAQSSYLYNGTTFDRLRSAPSGDGQAATGFQANIIEVFNGSTYDRLRGGLTSDGNAATGILNNIGLVFNGSTLDRLKGISATNNTATTSVGALQTVPLSTWQVNSVGGTAAQATVSKSSGGGTVRHVATSVTVCVSANGTAQPPLVFNLRDGATGAGTVIWTVVLSAPVTSSVCVPISGLNISGSAATAMTIESAAATAAAAQASVSLTGYSTP